MTRINSFSKIAAALSLALLIAVPSFAAARGSADFTRFVAVGDSYGAGYESGSLNANHQVFGWPAIIAQQAGLTICQPTAAATDPCFALPLVSYPGLPVAEPTLGLSGPVPGHGTGAPLMAGFGRPYNNLSVPGYTVGAAMTYTGAEGARAGLGQLILRGLGSEVDQAIAQHPTFIAVWLGGNDFLGAVSQGSPSFMTQPDAFKTQYTALLDKLVAGAPQAGMVVGTLPETFNAAPLTAMLPGVLLNPATQQPVLDPTGAPIPLIYLHANGEVGPLPAGSRVLLSALPALQQGYGIPPALKNVPPFNQLPHAGEPLSDAQTLTPEEMTAFGTNIASYNQTIREAAAARNIPVADVKGLFDRFAAATAAHPLMIGPFGFTNTYATGGLFSLDGVHLTDLGYMLMANEYIKAINAAYGTHIPVASVGKYLFQNNDPTTREAMDITFGQEVAAQMTAIFNSLSVTETPAPVRRRIIRH